MTEHLDGNARHQKIDTEAADIRPNSGQLVSIPPTRGRDSRAVRCVVVVVTTAFVLVCLLLFMMAILPSLKGNSTYVALLLSAAAVSCGVPLCVGVAFTIVECLYDD